MLYRGRRGVSLGGRDTVSESDASALTRNLYKKGDRGRALAPQVNFNTPHAMSRSSTSSDNDSEFATPKGPWIVRYILHILASCFANYMRHSPRPRRTPNTTSAPPISRTSSPSASSATRANTDISTSTTNATSSSYGPRLTSWLRPCKSVYRLMRRQCRGVVRLLCARGRRNSTRCVVLPLT